MIEFNGHVLNFLVFLLCSSEALLQLRVYVLQPVLVAHTSPVFSSSLLVDVAGAVGVLVPAVSVFRVALGFGLRPADVVLAPFFNKSNTFEHVSDIVDSSLLHC